MTARTIVGLLGLVVLLGIAIYLLFQIPWEYGIGGIVALTGILLVVGHDAPNAL
jgi:preprotein translocase subunit SecF